jgi:hypothetical protein
MFRQGELRLPLRRSEVDSRSGQWSTVTHDASGFCVDACPLVR